VSYVNVARASNRPGPPPKADIPGSRVRYRSVTHIRYEWIPKPGTSGYINAIRVDVSLRDGQYAVKRHGSCFFEKAASSAVLCLNFHLPLTGTQGRYHPIGFDSPFSAR
jgi:hypothetical protein